MKRFTVVVTLVAGMLVAATPARAATVVHSASASSCLPAGLVCARVDLQIEHQLLLGVNVYALRSSGLATALMAPGTMEARIRVSDADATLYDYFESCSWPALDTGCGVTLTDIFIHVPEALGTCTVPLTLTLSGTARAIDDPILRLLPVNALVMQVLRFCPGGVVQVL